MQVSSDSGPQWTVHFKPSSKNYISNNRLQEKPTIIAKSVKFKMEYTFIVFAFFVSAFPDVWCRLFCRLSPFACFCVDLFVFSSSRQFCFSFSFSLRENDQNRVRRDPRDRFPNVSLRNWYFGDFDDLPR